MPDLRRVGSSCARWSIIQAAIFFMGVDGPFRMIGCIFHAFNRCRFKGLICIRQFLDRLFPRIFKGREPLRAASLARATLSDLAWIRS